MKRNLLFNQLTAIGKRLAMVLTMLLIVGIGQAWGAEVLSETFIFNSTDGIKALGLTPPSSGNGTNLDANKTYSMGIVSLKVAHGSTNTRIWNSSGSYDLRVYKSGGKLTFSVPSGYQITAIQHTGTTANISTNVGSYNTGSWTGSAQSVIYTASGTLNLKKFVIVYEAINQSIDVTLHYNGTSKTLNNQTSPYTLPTTGDYVADACDDWRFTGWYDSEYKSTTAPTYITKLISTGSAYAVYSHTETIGGGAPTSTTTDNVFQNGTFANSTITWTLPNIVTIKQEQNGAQTAPNQNYINAPRWYAGNKITIKPDVNITTITVTTQSGYGKALSNATYGNATVAYNGTTVTITPIIGTNPIEIVIDDQARLNNLTVTYKSGGGTSTTTYTSSPECTAETTVTLNPDGGTFASTPDGWIKDGGNNYRKENVTGPVNLPNPTKTGYNFDGWYDDEIKVNSPYTPSETVTLTAKWTAKTTSITLDASNNGSGTNSSVTATYNQLLPNFTACSPATGYTLDGYYTAATGGTQIIDKDGKLVSNVLGYTSADGKWVNESLTLTLYAQYKMQQYTVTFNSNGGTAVEPQTIEHGGNATKPANPTKTGYTFAGWYTSADKEFDFKTPIESATTLYAKWNANQYTITFLKQYGSGGTDNATVTFNSNNFSVATIDLPTRNEYEFGGYYTEKGGAGLQIVDAEGKWLKNKTGYLDASGNWIKAGSVDLYAKWTKIHTITWVVNNNTETPHYTSMVLDGNTIDELPIAPADDLFEDCEVNAFVGWSTDNIGLEPDATAPTDLFKTIAEAQSKIGAINGDKKFYAVYAEEIESTTTFKRVHELSELNTSSKIAIINAFNKTKYILPTSLEAEATTPSENLGEITIGDGQYWNIEKDGDNWKFKSGNKYLAGTTIPTNNNKTGALALTESEDNTTWTIVKNTYEENGTPVFTIYNTDNTTAGLEYSNGWILYYATDFNTSWFTLNLYVPRTTYSNYITRCTALPDPVWGGATIDKTEIAVNCGETSSTNGAAKISFLKATNYNLYKDITVEVTSGNFIIASSRDGEYSTSVTLTPTQSGTNAGTLDGTYVYVRAVAPPMSSDQLTGTITISGKQITTQVINVTATVTCNEYTLTFNDCGDTKKITDFAGTSVEEMEPWAETCSEPVQYVFDGWATASVNNGTAEYEKVDFSTFTMPAANTTLYAVYRYAEEGGEPVNGYVKVTEALSDWSGDYVIVEDQKYNEQYKAIKNAYKKDYTLSVANVEIVDNEVISPEGDAIWSIRKNSETENYTMYNAATGKYAYIEKDDAKGAGLGTTAKDVVITFNNNKIATIKDVNIARCFSYYANDDEWRTYSSSNYNTGYLYRLSNKTIRYTSSLVCGTIEAEDAIVTSTIGQIVKVNVPITLNYSEAASITGTSDNEAFTVVTKNDVAVGESTIEVHYKPTAYVNTANQEETATITLTTSNGATTTFNITGRCLPETFAIVAKVGNIWYALPSQGLNSTTPPASYPVEVDNMADPTAVISVPANADWSLRQVYASSGSNDRFAANGENLVFVNNASPAMALNASQTGNYLLTDAQYNNYYSTYPGLYEWTPTTNDLETYTLTNAQRTDRTLNVATNTVFGVHSDNRATTEVRFLPIQNRYTPAALQVVEWKENSVVIMYNGDPAQTASVSVNGAAAQETILSSAQRDIAVYELAANDLAANPTQRLSITIGSEKTILSIPYIINSETTDATILPGSTVAARQEVAKVSDLVILKDATLTAAGAKGNPYKFRNVTVYGGGKLVVPADNGFGVNSLTLRIGGVTEEGNYDYVYPEFELNTTYDGAYSNTSGKINLDYVTTKSQYYTFVAPFEVETKDIKYPVDIYGSNVEAANRGSFEFQYYDGEARANGEKGWKVVEEDPTDGATLTAHKGYTFYGMPKKVSVNGGTSTRQKFGIHRIPMTETAAKVMSHENSEQTIAVSAYPSQYNINAGWNLIGNPYMSTITGLNNESIQTGTIVLVDDRWQWSNEADQYNHRFIVFPSNDGEWYYTSQASNANLPAFKNFFVQIAGEEINAISIPFTHRAPSGISARRATYETDKDIEMAIVLEKDEAHSDQMDFLINDAYGAGFDYNADFTKMMNNTQLNLYGVLMEDNLSFVALDHFTARGSIAIGYQVPSAGEYTLRISDKPYVMLDRIEALYVTDHEMNPAMTTNLMEEDYVFHVGKAEINDTRFTISFGAETNNGNGGDITTDMSEIDIHSQQPQKFLYDGRLYILRDGKVYSATGHEIKTINE